MQRLGDETLGNFGPVGVGGVDKIDSQLDCAPQDSDRLGMVGRFSPDASAGELHRAEAEPANGNIADQKCSARLRRPGVLYWQYLSSYTYPCITRTNCHSCRPFLGILFFWCGVGFFRAATNRDRLSQDAHLGGGQAANDTYAPTP